MTPSGSHTACLRLRFSKNCSIIGDANPQYQNTSGIDVCGMTNANKTDRLKTAVEKAIGIATFGSPRGTRWKFETFPGKQRLSGEKV
jgi:hypothetical protein